MLQVFYKANFRLMWGTKYVFMTFSAACLVAAVGAMVLKGFNVGIDFAGGTAVQVRFAAPPRIDEIRSALERENLGDVSLQRIGERKDNEVLVRVARTSVVEGGDEGGDVSARVMAALRGMEPGADAGRIDLNGVNAPQLRDWIAGVLPPPADPGAAPAVGPMAEAILDARNHHGGLFTDISQIASIPGVDPAVVAAAREQAVLGGIALRGVDFVGPTAGRELMHNTAWAILGSVTGILLYVWLRFHKVAWGLAAIVALVHDVTIAAGAMAFSGKEFSLTVVAALLTILGFSINDTIVIFDRIRENLRLYRDHEFERVVNASVNQTLSRSVLTSLTVFVAVFALFLYGGEKLNPMSFCLLVGLVFGSYSSIFVAAALLVVAHKVLGPKSVRA